MEIGVYTFVENTPDPATGQMLDPAQRLRDLIEEIELADQVGLEVFGIGEHHRPDFLGLGAADAAGRRGRAHQNDPAVAARSRCCRSDDPVRVYQQYSPRSICCPAAAPRSWPGAARSSRCFPLFGYDLNDYDELFAEKLELLVKIRDNERVTWQGQHRAPLQRPGGLSAHAEQDPDLGRGRRQSAVGDPRRHARTCRWRSPSSAACRSASRRSSICSARPRSRPATTPTQLPVGINTHGYVADTSQAAADEFFPSYAAQMTHIGRERGWPPTTRAQFDAGLHLRAPSRRRQPRAGDRENPLPARSARPSALSDADERRHHAACADHALDRAVRNEGRAGGAERAEDKPSRAAGRRHRAEPVAVVDVLAELGDAVGRRPGGDIDPIERHRLGSRASLRSPLLITASISWRDQPGVSISSQFTSSRTFCTRTQPDEWKRMSSPNKSFDGVSCM